MLSIWRRRANDFDSGSRYPDDPSSPPPMFRGMPDVLVDRCRGHAACAEACPSQALRVETQLSGWVWELDRASCVACGKCAEACPERAIVISRAFELAARTREALQVRVTFHRAVSEVAE